MLQSATRSAKVHVCLFAFPMFVIFSPCFVFFAVELAIRKVFSLAIVLHQRTLWQLIVNIRAFVFYNLVGDNSHTVSVCCKAPLMDCSCNYQRCFKNIEKLLKFATVFYLPKNRNWFALILKFVWLDFNQIPRFGVKVHIIIYSVIWGKSMFLTSRKVLGQFRPNLVCMPLMTCAFIFVSIVGLGTLGVPTREQWMIKFGQKTNKFLKNFNDYSL